MKVLLIFFYLLTIMSCKTKQLYYYGIIVDQEQRALSEVNITDGFQSTFSNKEGYFQLYREYNVISDLTFSKTGFETKTVKIVRTIQGESIGYTFLNKIADTVILKKITLPKTSHK